MEESQSTVLWVQGELCSCRMHDSVMQFWQRCPAEMLWSVIGPDGGSDNEADRGAKKFRASSMTATMGS